MVPETLEPSLQLASAVLSELKMPQEEVAQAIQTFRKTHISDLQVGPRLSHRQDWGSSWSLCALSMAALTGLEQSDPLPQEHLKLCMQQRDAVLNQGACLLGVAQNVCPLCVYMCDCSSTAGREVHHCALRYCGRSCTGLCIAVPPRPVAELFSSSSCPVCRCCAATVGPRWATVRPCIPDVNAALLIDVGSRLFPA